MNANVRESRGRFGHVFEHQVRKGSKAPPSAIFASFVFKPLSNTQLAQFPICVHLRPFAVQKNWVAGELPH